MPLVEAARVGTYDVPNGLLGGLLAGASSTCRCVALRGRGRRVAPATHARRLTAMSGFYSEAQDEGLIDCSPVARVRPPRVCDESPRLVWIVEIAAFLDAAEASGPRDHALACLLVLNGLRASDALDADVSARAWRAASAHLPLRPSGGKRQTAASRRARRRR